MNRKITAAVAALLLIFSNGAFESSIYAEETGNNTGTASYSDSDEELFSYRVKDDGTVEITEWYKDSGNIYIPAVLDDKLITSIGEYAFFGFEKVNMVIMPPTITSIGEGAFLSCKNMHEFVVPDSVEFIGDCALGCLFDEKTETISFDEDYKIYGYDDAAGKTYADQYGIAYHDYSELMRFDEFNGQMILWQADIRLTKADIPSYVDGKPVVKIGPGLEGFKNCIYLSEVTIPDTVEQIGSCAFKNTALSVVTLPESISVLDFSAFEDCYYLEKINIPEKVTSIGKNTFSDCVSLESIGLHNNITEIGDYAFNGCASLKTISLPSSVKRLGDYIFTGCTSLEEIKVSPDNSFYYDEDGILYKETHWVTGNITKDLVAYPAGRKETDFTVPKGIQTIYKGAFSHCQNLKNVKISQGTEHLEVYAFSNSESLEKVTLPSSVWIIEKNFTDCPNLTVYAEKTDAIEEYIANTADSGFNDFVLTDKTDQSEDNFITGDINGDEVIDITDLSLLSLNLLGDKEFTEQQKKAADVDKNGAIELPDLATLRQFISKVITSF